MISGTVLRKLNALHEMAVVAKAMRDGKRYGSGRTSREDTR